MTICDFCPTRLDNVPSTAVHLILDADELGNGTVTSAYNHVCKPCFLKIKVFLQKMRAQHPILHPPSPRKHKTVRPKAGEGR